MPLITRLIRGTQFPLVCTEFKEGGSNLVADYLLEGVIIF